MFPHRSLFLAILRVAIFSIEVPEAKSITCLRRQPRARNALSFGTEVLKMATRKIARINDRWGISFYVFYLLDWTSFSLLHGNPVSSTFVYFLEFVCKQKVHSFVNRNESEKQKIHSFVILTNSKYYERIWEAKNTNLDSGLVLLSPVYTTSVLSEKEVVQ